MYEDYETNDTSGGGGADVGCADDKAIISDGIKSYEIDIKKPSITIGVYSNAKITLQKIDKCGCTPMDPGQQACDNFMPRYITIKKQE